jgi:hypothetical protein
MFDAMLITPFFFFFSRTIRHFSPPMICHDALPCRADARRVPRCLCRRLTRRLPLRCLRHEICAAYAVLFFADARCHCHFAFHIISPCPPYRLLFTFRLSLLSFRYSLPFAAADADCCHAFDAVTAADYFSSMLLSLMPLVAAAACWRRCQTPRAAS